MNGPIHDKTDPVASKIARLVQEQGWNLNDFARASGLSPQTVRDIVLARSTRRLRNATVSRCARAFGLAVGELRDEPFEHLLRRIDVGKRFRSATETQRLYELATQPALRTWLEQNPERAQQLRTEDWDELLSLQGTGGPLTPRGVDEYVRLIERKRCLIEQVHAVAGTEYLEVLEMLVALMYEKIQPYRDRR